MNVKQLINILNTVFPNDLEVRISIDRKVVSLESIKSCVDMETNHVCLDLIGGNHE